MASRKSQKVIAHYLDGTLLKGTTPDFRPSRARFHVTDEDGDVHKIDVNELKALFFVRNFEGRSDYRERKGFFADASGDKVLVEFFDGEILFGHAGTYTNKGNGFFLVPGDPDSNNIKVFVVHSSTKRVKVKESKTSSVHAPVKKRAASKTKKKTATKKKGRLVKA